MLNRLALLVFCALLSATYSSQNPLPFLMINFDKLEINLADTNYASGNFALTNLQR